jgi:ATP synthase protein I
MQLHDASTVRRAALPAAVVGVVLTAVFAVTAGGKGLLGALCGVAVANAFFLSSLLILGRAVRRNPLMFMNIAMLLYLVKVIALGVLLVLWQDTTMFDTRAFGWTVLVSALVWMVSEVRVFSQLQTPYVEPEQKPGHQP